MVAKNFIFLCFSVLFYFFSPDLLRGQTYTIKDTAQANFYYRQADSLRNKRQPSLAIPLLQKARLIHEQVQRDSMPLALTYTSLANYFIEQNNLDSALFLTFQSLQIRKNIFKNQELALSGPYMNLGYIYDRKRDYDKAIAYTEKALNLFKQKPQELAFRIGQASNNLGSFYENKGAHRAAIPYFHQAIYYYSKKFNDANHIEFAMPNLNLGTSYAYLQQFDSALVFIDRALEIRQAKFKRPNPDIAICLNAKATVLLESERFNEALPLFQEALDFRRENWGEKHYEVAESYGNIGQLYLKKGVFDTAVAYRQKALLALNYLTINDLSVVNDLGQLHTELRDLGNTYLTWFKVSNDTAVLQKAAQTFENGLKVVQYEYNTFDTEGSKLTMRQASFEMQEGILTTQILRGDKLHLERAFGNTELFKASLLREQINDIKGLQTADMPQDIIQKDDDLRKNLADLDRQIYDLKSQGTEDTAVTVLSLKGQKFDLEQTYAQLKRMLEEKYPAYYRLKYDLNTISSTELQEKILSPNQSLLEYFVGDSSIFIFVVNKDNFTVKAIAKDFPLDSLIRSTLSGIYDYQLAADSLRTDALKEQCDKAYTNGAYRLYEKLIAPVKTLLKPNLVIVPDATLHYLPFEALLTAKPPKTYNYLKNKYLGNEYTMSYAHSATLLQEMRTKKHQTEPTKLWLGMAPFCNSDTALLTDLFTFSDIDKKRAGFDTLRFAAQEVANIQALMTGESRFNEDATVAAFKKLTPRYRVIHLATHAKAQDDAGNFSFLVFSNPTDKSKKELLYARDLYNMTLNGDLVVLSACETGIGQLQRGEGVVGLSRAFTFAGAKSLVTSLWRVNDASSKDLMIAFYKELRRGKPKDAALHIAKMRLKNQEKYAAPYYWASFICLGDAAPLKK